MVRPDDASAGTLQIDGFSLSVGPVSVGLPTACTSDVVLLRYLDLLQLVHRANVEPPDDHIEVLVEASGLDGAQIRERLRRLGAP